MRSDALGHALAYAALGWPVLHVEAGGKKPLNGYGIKHATTNEAQIRRWFGIARDANVGIHLEPAGLVAVDIDPRNGGDLQLLDELPLTLTAKTGGGGRHALFKAPTGARFGANCARVSTLSTAATSSASPPAPKALIRGSTGHPARVSRRLRTAHGAIRAGHPTGRARNPCRRRARAGGPQGSERAARSAVRARRGRPRHLAARRHGAARNWLGTARFRNLVRVVSAVGQVRRGGPAQDMGQLQGARARHHAGLGVRTGTGRRVGQHAAATFRSRRCTPRAPTPWDLQIPAVRRKRCSALARNDPRRCDRGACCSPLQRRRKGALGRRAQLLGGRVPTSGAVLRRNVIYICEDPAQIQLIARALLRRWGRAGNFTAADVQERIKFVQAVPRSAARARALRRQYQAAHGQEHRADRASFRRRPAGNPGHAQHLHCG